MKTGVTESSKGFSAALLLLITAAYALLSLWTPLALDDWIFMAEWRDVNGDKALSPATLYDFWKEIRLYDNGRLSNTLAPLSTMFSPWKDLFPVLNGIMVAAITAFASYFSFQRQFARPFNIAVAWMALFFLLPWRNSLFVADYSLNYIWASAITMLFMIVVIHCENGKYANGWSIRNFILTLLLAFLSGAWHEGFAAATLGGFILYTLVKRQGFSAQWFCIGLFYAVTTFAFYFCPGLLARTSDQFGVSGMGNNLLKIVFDFLPVVFLVAAVVLTAALPSLRLFLRKAWEDSWFVIGTGIVVIGTLLSLLFTHQPRSAFWPDLMAVVMLFILTRTIWHSIETSRFRMYVTLLALGSCLVPMGYILTWQHTLYEESEQILAEMEQSESGTVYRDLIPSSDIPLITLKMTNHGAWTTHFHYHALKQYARKPYPAVVPAELENTDGALPAEGSAGALRKGNSLILPYAAEGAATVAVEVALKNGESMIVPALSLPYMGLEGPSTYILPYGVSVEDIDGMSIMPLAE